MEGFNLRLNILLKTAVFLSLILSLLAACADIGGFEDRNNQPNSDVDSHALKIVTRDPGMYQVTAEMLSEAGVQLEDYDPDQIKLYNRFLSRPFWLGGEDAVDSIRFYARQGNSAYTDENIYWLVLCASGEDCIDIDKYADLITANEYAVGVSDLEVKLLDSLPDDAYYAELHLEDNEIYKPQLEGDDHWFWHSLTAPDSKSVEFETTNLAPGRGWVRVEVWGSTDANQTPNHHIIIRLNQHQILEDQWDGKGVHILEGDFDAVNLIEGSNVLEVLSPGDTGVAADIVLINQIQVSYPREFWAVDDRLEFVSLGGEHILRGFSEPVSVYKITNPDEPRYEGEYDGSQVSLSGETGQRYLAAGIHGFLSPVRIERAALEFDLRDPGLAVDYVAVGPEDLLGPIKPLMDLRKERGLDVLSVPLGAIYDQFNAGYPEPEAIRSFLRYAINNWQNPPEYLLLVGDSSYDPRGYISTADANRLPVFLLNTNYGGQTASDVGYAQLNDRVWSSDGESNSEFDLAVGRLPARNAEQLKIVVDKIIRYETSTEDDINQGAFPGKVLAIADSQSASFKQDAQSFLDMFPDSTELNLVAPEIGQTGINQEIISRLNGGNSLVAYFGHGSINMWGKERLFSIEDVRSVEPPDNLPIVLNFTCLTGLFTHPQHESLAESLLWKENGGAVAVLAPTSLTLPNDQGFLVQSLVELMLSDPSLPIGEVLKQAREAIPLESQGLREVVYTFLLFGDPAMGINF